ncbi:MAG TPA: efflux RND transporter periplasmic adaptor subunit [Catalimonadaceae bacterium]|nr:efflux RND transporter periplasmic adaptor subunit [Catalimonadaceae bacterium]
MTQSKPTGTKAIWIIIIFLLVLAGLVFWKMSGNPVGQGAPGGGGTPGGKPPASKVTGFIARQSNIPITLESSGSILAWNEVQLMPEIGGKITQMSIKEGIEVSEGQILIKLFDEDLKAQLKKQELQAGIAEKNLMRLQDLLKINGVSQQEIDNAENQLNNIASEILLLKANLKKTEIRAPFSGKIGLTNASIGSYASPGNVLASLQELNTLKIEFSIPEKYSSQLQTGDPIKFTIESQPDTFKGNVYAFEPKIDLNNRSLRVRAKTNNPGNRLLPGSFARVQVRLREIKNAVLIPNESLIPDTRGKKVIVFRNGIADFVPVETGIRNENMIQVVRGISAGDTIINSGLMFVKPKAEIQLTRIQ